MTKLNKVLIAVAGLVVLMLLPLTAMAQAPGGGPGWRGGDQGGGQGRGQMQRQGMQQQREQRPEARMSEAEILSIDEGEMLIELKLTRGDKEGFVQYHERTRFVMDGEKAEISAFSKGDTVWVALLPPRELGDEFHLAFMGDEKPQPMRDRGRDGFRGGEGERGEKMREMLKPVEVKVTKIDADEGEVTIETEDGWSHTYKVGERAKLLLDGEKAELEDFSKGEYYALAPGLKGEGGMRDRLEDAERELPLMLLCDEASLEVVKERFQERMQERPGFGGEQGFRGRNR